MAVSDPRSSTVDVDVGRSFFLLSMAPFDGFLLFHGSGPRWARPSLPPDTPPLPGPPLVALADLRPARDLRPRPHQPVADRRSRLADRSDGDLAAGQAARASVEGPTSAKRNASAAGQHQPPRVLHHSPALVTDGA